MDGDELGDARLRGPESGGQDQTRNIREGAADGASSALHAACLRAVSRGPPCCPGGRGRTGSPRSAEPPLEVAVTRSLRLLDPSVTLEWVKQVTGLYEPHEILRAKSQTELARPGDVRGFFKAQFRAVVPTRDGRPGPVPCGAIRIRRPTTTHTGEFAGASRPRIESRPTESRK